MAIPPHRAPGEVGHIEDHNAIVDVLTGNDADIADVTTELDQHKVAVDAHGDRAWASTQFAPINHTHTYPVTSVQGQTGAVEISAADVGAETPVGSQNKVNALQTSIESNFVPLSQKGSSNGVTPLNASGMIDPQYIPGFGGSSRVTASDTAPTDPNVGDIWINIAEEVPDPIPVTPGFYRTTYSGPPAIAFADLPAAGTIANFPGETFAPVSFMTGPTGFTKVKVNLAMGNNATSTSTVLLTYSLIGTGVNTPGGFDHGGYQSPRGVQSSAVPRMMIEDEWTLPPNTQVTLTPMFRLSSNPSQANQDGSNNDLKFYIDPTFPPNILIECW